MVAGGMLPAVSHSFLNETEGRILPFLILTTLREPHFQQ